MHVMTECAVQQEKAAHVQHSKGAANSVFPCRGYPQCTSLYISDEFVPEGRPMAEGHAGFQENGGSQCDSRCHRL